MRSAKLDMLLNEFPLGDSILNSVPFAVALIWYPSFRYAKVNAAYCSRLKDKLLPNSLVNVDVHRILTSPSSDAIQALEMAHRYNTLSRTKHVVSENFCGGVSYWDVTVAPLFKEGDETLVATFMTETSECTNLKAKIQEKEANVGSWIHRLRTPLTAIKNMNYLIQRRLQDISPDDLNQRLSDLDRYINSLSREISVMDRE